MLPACSYKNEIDSNYYCQKLKFSCVKKNKIALFKTSKGDFLVKLFGKDNPVTVSNFLQNVDKNIYVNKKFYKIINYPHITFIHGGLNPKNKFHVELNQTLKFKKSPTIPLEIKFQKEIKPRYNYQVRNPSETENLVNTFESGSIAMVKSGKNNSSTEFFFVTNKIPELDGRYSIFGKIIKGLDVLEKINKEDFISEVKISN